MVINFYKHKLVELGVMKELKNRCITKKGKLEKKKTKTTIKKEKKETVKKEKSKKEEVKQEAPKKRGRPRKNG